MISFELALLLMTAPCNSPVEYQERGQIVAMCALPERPGPNTPPGWMPPKKAEPKIIKAKASKKTKKKSRKKKRRTRR